MPIAAALPDRWRQRVEGDGPPEAEPVSAASVFVATASDTSGPPPMPSTASRTMTKAGSGHDAAEADETGDADQRQAPTR